MLCVESGVAIAAHAQRALRRASAKMRMRIMPTKSLPAGETHTALLLPCCGPDPQGRLAAGLWAEGSGCGASDHSMTFGS
jgi:hypothetical protein